MYVMCFIDLPPTYLPTLSERGAAGRYLRWLGHVKKGAWFANECHMLFFSQTTTTAAPDANGTVDLPFIRVLSVAVVGNVFGGCGAGLMWTTQG